MASKKKNEIHENISFGRKVLDEAAKNRGITCNDDADLANKISGEEEPILGKFTAEKLKTRYWKKEDKC